ncbi:MAG: 23S rRNA (uracil(1939)-C(5))-methyltransferase RlmD [Eubacteriales bacterium]|nr:23S rRNA (uracil(1939)-C(5))-methyltransferase RlmD [Eubacteriales bacterium]
MKKNDRTIVNIHATGQNGEGIGRTEAAPDQVGGFTLFVKDAIEGDRAEVVITKVKKNYGYAKVLKILEPSSKRVEAPCPIASRCGGCQIQAMSYEAQLEMKQQKVLDDLVHIGGFKAEEVPMEPILGMSDPFRYRNKAQFPIGTDKNGQPIAGFYAGRTHSIIPCEDCLLGINENKEILERILNWMKTYRIPAYNEETGKGLVRHVLIRKGFATGEIIVCMIVNGQGIPEKNALIQVLCEVPGMTGITWSSNTKATNVIMNGPVKTLWGQSYITDYLRYGEKSVGYQISPASFYQVNPVQTEVLYGKALEYAGLTGEETVMDLYCGIGTISLFLAQKAREVIGVEIVPEAIADAKRNAKLNGFENARFFVGKAEEVVPDLYEKEKLHADVVVVDPPRKGCDETLLSTIVSMQPERIVYVSCDPATLARDLKYLNGENYKIEKVQPVDQFPHTVHVECVCLMSKVQK